MTVAGTSGIILKMKKSHKATMLLEIANTPIFFKNKRNGKIYVHFGDINRGEHIVPYSDIRISQQFVKEAPTPDEDNEMRYFVYIDNREIEITGCMYFELADDLMKKGA